MQGELDKLAANISIGPEHGGSSLLFRLLRLTQDGRTRCGRYLDGTGPDLWRCSPQLVPSRSDGDYVTISGEAGSCPSISISDRHGNQVDPRDWWLRHVSGQELGEDL